MISGLWVMKYVYSLKARPPSLLNSWRLPAIWTIKKEHKNSPVSDIITLRPRELESVCVTQAIRWTTRKLSVNDWKKAELNGASKLNHKRHGNKIKRYYPLFYNLFTAGINYNLRLILQQSVVAVCFFVFSYSVTELLKSETRPFIIDYYDNIIHWEKVI